MSRKIERYARPSSVDIVNDGAWAMTLAPAEDGCWSVQQRQRVDDDRTPSGYSWPVRRSFTGTPAECRAHIERLLDAPRWDVAKTMLETNASAWDGFVAAMSRLGRPNP